MTYSATGLPAGLSIYSSGLISGTLASTAAGTYYVTVSVSDGALNASASFTWIVYNVNNPPIITNPGNQTNNENESVNLPISASDPDGQSLTYSATGLPAGLSIYSSGLISGTLASTAAGTYYVTVSVSDGALNASASFTWIVYNVNNPPIIINPGNQTNNENESVNLPISASDPDGQSLTYSATGLPAGLSIYSSGLISGTFSFYCGGNILRNCIGVRWCSLMHQHLLHGLFYNVNNPPIIINPGNQTNNENESVNLPISASDPDGQSLTYSATGLPAGLSIYSSGLISGTLASTAAGTYYVTVSVSDGALNASTSFTWIVYNVNNPPTIINPGNQTNNENESVNLPISASDPDGQSLTYSATGLPPYLSISSSGLISGTLASTAAGTYYVTVSVSDGALNASASFTWIVYNVNNPPIIINPGNQTNNENESVNLPISASDPDGQSLTYSATGLPPYFKHK